MGWLTRGQLIGIFQSHGNVSGQGEGEWKWAGVQNERRTDFKAYPPNQNTEMFSFQDSTGMPRGRNREPSAFHQGL